MTMTVAILGAAGQLGRALARRLPLQGYAVIPLTRPAWNVADAGIVSRLVGLRPSALVNAAAMTNVDGCEREPERAYGVNGWGAEHVARAAAELGIPLVHVSTDYVFDDLNNTAPYAEDAPTNPLSVYGASKLDGERRVLAVYPQAKIARTAWLYGPIAAGAEVVCTISFDMGGGG